jgi:hypothetical protein
MFTYNDTVRVKGDAPLEMRPGARTWVIGVTPNRKGEGATSSSSRHLVEFEGGEAIDIHESMLVAATV